MSETTEIAPEMRLFSREGRRLYLNASERSSFLAAASHEQPVERLFCHVLHYTGCRPCEALQLIIERVYLEENSLLFRSLKKRKLDNKGRLKQPQFRSVPIPGELMDTLTWCLAYAR